jgi:hypothetical protein
MFKKLFGIATVIATILFPIATSAATNQVGAVVFHSTIKPLNSLQDMNDSSSRWDIFVGTLNTTFGTGFAYIDSSGNLARLAYGATTTYQRGDGTLQTLDTSVVPENTNLYFTNSRFDTRFATKTTTDLAEGTNLYYTTARFDTQLATKTTTNLAEGSNLYFTDARAIAAPLTGYSSGAGTVAATDTILQAVQKLNGNIALKADDSAVVKLAGTQTVTGAKTFDEALTLTQVTTPANPAAGKNKIYVKSDDKVYKLTSAGVESEVGSGGGGSGSGTNLALFDTAANSWAATKTNNFNADVSVGDWLAYADAAGTVPVDMTGGSPNTTCTQTTSSPLNGAGSLLMTVSSGASRQGEGCSLLVNVPTAYRNSALYISFPFTYTGTVATGDFVVAAYDVTNGALLYVSTLNAIDANAASGTLRAYIPKLSGSQTQIRVGIHIARTTTGVATVKWDDFQVSPDSGAATIQMGGTFVGSAYTPGTTNCGDSWSVSSASFADHPADSDCPTPTMGGIATAPATKIPAIVLPYTRAGTYQFIVEGWLGNSSASAQCAYRINDGTVSSAPAGGSNQAVNGFTGSITYTAGSPTPKTFNIQAYSQSGSCTISAGNSPQRELKISVYWMPSEASVTGNIFEAGDYGETLYTPTFTGFGTVSASSFTHKRIGDTIYVQGWFTSGTSTGVAGQISLPTGLTVDSTKVVTGRLTGAWQNSAGGLDPVGNSMFAVPGNSYVTFRSRNVSTTVSSDQTASTIFSSGQTGYVHFSVPITGWSTFPFGVSVSGFNSGVRLYDGNGYGATSTKILRYSNMVTTGTDVTCVDDSNLGTVCTINAEGNYSMGISRDDNAGGAYMGISLNSSQLTTGISAITAYPDRLCLATSSGSNLPQSCGYGGHFLKGAIIRPHAQGDATGGLDAASYFFINRMN